MRSESSPQEESGQRAAVPAAALSKLDEYELIGRLGAGGMGVVYRARHIHLKRDVALKVVSASHPHTDAAARIRREIEALGRLNHPNIVQAYDAHLVEGAFILAMEFVVGADLAQLLAQSGPMPVAAACEVVRQAALGLQHAAERGLVHRDIKPSNLIVTRQGQVKILDLGLALLASQTELTRPDRPVGTADYMAPEQVLDSHSVDTRADLYSLGCTLYRMLAGRTLFGEPDYSTSSEKITAHAFRPPPSLRAVRPDVPEELAAVLARLLEKDPKRRFANGAETEAAIAPFASADELTQWANQTMNRLPERREQPPGDGPSFERDALRAPTPAPTSAPPWRFALPIVLAALLASAFTAAALWYWHEHGMREHGVATSREQQTDATAEWPSATNIPLDPENMGFCSGNIGSPEDTDVLCLQAKASGPLQVLIEPQRGLALDVRISDAQPSKGAKGESDAVASCVSEKPGGACRFSVEVKKDIKYFLTVHSKDYASRGFYRVRVRPAQETEKH